MKELSIEDKAKRYDKAYEMAKKLKETCDSNAVVGWMEYIFPELKESGDIRKRIIDALHGDVLEMGEIKKAIAWLEKQGNLMKALQISNAKIGELIEKNYYLKEQLEKQGEQKTTIEMITPEESLGIDSDTYNKIVDECIYGEQKPIKEHNACEFCEDRYGCVSPCSMKLIEEEKPADNVKPKFHIGDIVKRKDNPHLTYILKRFTDDGDYEFHAIGKDGNEGCTCFSVVKYQDEWELVEQPAWGEEDIELLDNTIKFIEDRVAATSPSLRTYSPTLTGKEIPFLKALKDRVQPKQEWSEEDEKILNLIIARLHSHPNVEAEEYGKDYHWLKSLKDRYTWKPSELQIECLSDAVKHYNSQGYHAPILKELLSDLKKLKG